MSAELTISAILNAETWNRRIQQIRLIPQRHGTGEHGAIYAAVARQIYMPHLAPDFAYIHEAPFYDTDYFFRTYDRTFELTSGFFRVGEADLIEAMINSPSCLLIFRTLLGLTKEEFAHSSILAGAPANLAPLSSSQVDKMERTERVERVAPVSAKRALHLATIAARTITEVLNGDLFGEAPSGLRIKQDKPDTERGWESVRDFASGGVPLKVFLHQRHYGGAFRQVLDATSSRRGDLIEDAVEALFTKSGISFVRTGSQNQADIARRFEVIVTPAPDFVVFDPRDDTLKAMLECKGTNNGGTARDKALRFARLAEEARRLGGVPLIAVLGGIGWARINDALGPVIRDTDGRVFTMSTLASILEVSPFPSLTNAETPGGL